VGQLSSGEKQLRLACQTVMLKVRAARILELVDELGLEPPPPPEPNHDGPMRDMYGERTKRSSPASLASRASRHLPSSIRRLGVARSQLVERWNFLADPGQGPRSCCGRWMTRL
jgi:hypothetical protein